MHSGVGQQAPMLIRFFGHAQGLSIACSTPEAVCWDPSWANTHEISGRAMKNVHDSAEGFQYERRQDMKEKRSADDFVGEIHFLCSREHGTQYLPVQPGTFPVFRTVNRH